MKETILTFILMYFSILGIAQTYKGNVKDAKGETIPFANVVLFSLPDSTFVEGTTTNDFGKFLLESKKVTNSYLEISSIGYETQTIPAKENVGTITLKEAVNELGEVVVKAERPTIRQMEGKMIVGIRGSSLSEAGNLMDVFKRTPGLQVQDGSISVFGKGKPIVFINGREVQNASEYESLQSDDIATIEIDRNPSAKYSASGNSVVRITTKEITKDRINLQVFNQSVFARKYSNISGVNLNSKWKNTQISANYSYSYRKDKNYEDAYEINTQPNYSIRNENISERIPTRKTHNLFTSISQKIEKKHTLGGQFSYVDMGLKTDGIANQKISKSNMPIIKRKLNNDDDYAYNLSTYNLNYHFDIDSITKLQILGDYTHSAADDNTDILENNLTTNTLQRSKIVNSNDYDVYSARADFETVFVSKIPFQIGFKFSQVENNGATLATSELNGTDKYRTSNLTTDRIGASYVMITPKIGKWNTEAGLRYEYTDRNIVASEKTVLDTTYGEWFPSMNISRKFSDKFNLAFTYNKKISRPSFRELNSNRNYIDSLSYNMGNPKLKATISHNLAINMGFFNKLFVGLEYEYSNNDRIVTGINDSQNPDIVAYTDINIDKSEYLRATIDYNKSYRFWKGTFSAVLEKPFIEIPYLGEMKKVDNVSYYFRMNNDFKVYKKTTLFCNFSYSSPSEDLMSYYYKSYNLSAGLNTSFLDDKLKLSLYVNDILNSSETAWKDQFGNVESYSDQDRDNTFFSISLKYNFNRYREGIRKKTAGSEELNRM